MSNKKSERKTSNRPTGKNDIYDLIIIGGGPAGLSAAVYTSCFKLKAAVIAKIPGGTVTLTSVIKNYPGMGRINAADFVKKWIEHVEMLRVPIINENVIGISVRDGMFSVDTEKKSYLTKTIIIATGMKRKELGVPGEKEYATKGVSYCAVCDGPLYRDAIVAVVGGSDSAAKEAVLLARYAKKVYIIYRRDKLRAEPATIDEVENEKKIEVIYNSVVTEILGGKNGMVNAVNLENVVTKKKKRIAIDGIFIEIGGIPSSDIAKDLGIKLNDENEIIVDSECRTNIPGIFAAGDVTNTKYKQIITAAAQGAIATFNVYSMLKEKNKV